MLPEVYELECPAGTIPIHIQASQRKTIGIQIRADQRVEIRVPYRTAYHEVISVIQEKADWIVSHYERAVCEAQERKSAPCPYQDRTWLPCGDEKVFLRIRYEEGRTRAQLQSVREKDGRITLAVTAGPGDGAGIRSLISQWYRHAGARKIAARAHAYAGQMGVSFRKITVKEQKTCWGSCSGRTLSCARRGARGGRSSTALRRPMSWISGSPGRAPATRPLSAGSRKGLGSPCCPRFW